MLVLAPIHAMVLRGFIVAAIFFVRILACGVDGIVAKIIAHGAQVHLAVEHMRGSGMSKPVRGSFADG